MKEKNDFNLTCNLSILIFIVNYILLFCMYLSQGINSTFGFIDNKLLALVIIIGIITSILILKSVKIFKLSFISFLISYIYLFTTYLNQENKVLFSYLDSKLLIAVIVLSIVTSILILKSNKKNKVSFICFSASYTYLFVTYLIMEDKVPFHYVYNNLIIAAIILSTTISILITKFSKDLKYPFIFLILVSTISLIAQAF